MMKKCIVYIGDFDFRNENVQAHLVKNNGKIFNSLGYHVEYIGINRNISSFQEIAELSEYYINDENHYTELPDTLSFSGLLKISTICNAIVEKLNELKKIYDVSNVITYQSPSYAIAVEKIAKWCKRNNVSYVVNCADLPTFELQSFVRRIVMKMNWHYLHKVNKKRADGVIAVSNFIADYYSKKGRACVIIPPLFDTTKLNSDISSNVVPKLIYAGTPFKITGHEAAPEGMKDRLDKIIDLLLVLSKKGIEYSFDIVGITKEDYLDGVPRHAALFEGESKIHFWGKRSHDDTLRMVEQADFSINYRDENLMTMAGFSTKIVESVSLGTPVIINSISDTFLYLRDGSDGFMLSGNHEQDIEKLKMLCTFSQEERFKLKCSLYEKKIFDITKYVDIMGNFLHSLTDVERK